jgi:hypothetical protein
MSIGNRPPTAWFTRDRLALAGVLVVALAVRGIVLWAMRENLQQDPDAYREIAENLLKHGEFALGKRKSEFDVLPSPTAYRPPLYPVVLSNLPAADRLSLSLAKVAWLHLVLGLSTVWITWMTARRLLDSWAPLPAALFVACDPILLNQQTLIMTETLATFLAILSLWCLARFDAQRSWFNAGLAGGAIGLAILCRPTFLPWLALIALTMLFVRGGPNPKSQIPNPKCWAGSLLNDFGWRLANTAALLIIAAGIISPWTIRNYQVFGTPIITTTHGGYTLYLANNKAFYDYLAKGKFDLPWDAASMRPVVFAKDLPLTEESVKVLALLQETAKAFEQEQRARGYTNPRELWDDRIANVLARSFIREHPHQFISASLYRIRQLWSPLPHKLTANESTGRRLLRYATAAWYCGVYLLAAIGIWRLRRRLLQPPWLWGVLLCLAFTAVHTFYWTNLRMRAPLMPFIAIVAAAAIPRTIATASPLLPA